ncbi:hypothetical protein PPERSA_08239 [Pseudocohnilembus persalinus]|uniref:Uncharacterized protein n=1 Tax=Pseudocohnilembus persalinus TaxID=266149 RepID=A0A0V0QFZ4_PSEPJ|nr:hypothetical protein PPERSA_08239 [Pseudocohnilembus persalinus]|eukprot:KRX01138.1 hypothetical protein PPERSA_08239 [Pseudocohnilembus persalinus]
MALHVYLLKQRIQQEKNKSVKNDAETLLYYCKTNHYPEFAQKYNENVPVEDFTDYFIENYSNRFELINEELENFYLGKDQLFENQQEIKLDSLDYSDILNYKIYWGLQKDPEQLENQNQ